MKKIKIDNHTQRRAQAIVSGMVEHMMAQPFWTRVRIALRIITKGRI